MVTATDTRTDTLRGLSGVPLPPPDPTFTAGEYLAAARLMAAADGASLNRLKRAALALKRGDEPD